MSTHNDGGPAFPVLTGLRTKEPSFQAAECASGMTLRQYAAIHLRAPNSGDDWLDDMIREAQRNDFAAKAMQAFLHGAVLPPGFDAKEQLAFVGQRAYEMADAMLAARGAA